MPSKPMNRLWWLASALCLAVLLPRNSAAQSQSGYGDYVDWEGWARVNTSERPGLKSSYDPFGGSLDFNHYEYPPGFLWGEYEDVTAATIRGPGIIYRFWMPHRTASLPFEVKMYFDGETTPRINTDSKRILDANYSYFDAPLVTTFAGGQVCYEPIAFRDSIRIDTDNRAGLQHYYQYTYRTFPPGTDIESWNGLLDPEQSGARNATRAMFTNAGQHPAGERPDAIRNVVGPTTIPGGSTLTIAELTGPGLIRRLNVRLDNPTDPQLENLQLRVYWDGEESPSIEAPVGWFFGAGNNRAAYRSLPMGTDSPAGYYCYWPMPFRHGAKLQLVNSLATSIPIDSTVVEYLAGSVDTTLAYLHAHARQGVRAEGSFLYDMAETNGTGHYVGNFLFLEQDFDDDYMLEGDDILVVDGTIIAGSGLEDAYNGGYYYNWVSNPMPEPEGPSPPYAIRPLNGILRRQRQASPPLARADQYRWMIADRVSFTQSLEVSIENRYAVAGSRWKSVVFWYQLPLAATDTPPPAGSGNDGRGLQLQSIQPNPGRDAILVRFALPSAGKVSLEIVDVTGRRVATLADGDRSAGVHDIEWNRGNLPDGVYFVRLQADGTTELRKLTLLH